MTDPQQAQVQQLQLQLTTQLQQKLTHKQTQTLIYNNMEVTIGGNRVGSGKKMQAHLNNYHRSTHNLSETFASSMGSGILYPALCKLGMRGDSFDISINADARTIPTQGPLFGSFKMQVDVYQCPVRLYQSILHNNPLAIGLKMGQVKFPLLEIESETTTTDKVPFDKSSLMHYLGMSGLGRRETQQDTKIARAINALPFLSYYDIFKTYYANKQEDKAYVISAKDEGIKVGTIDDNWYDVLNGSAIANIFDNQSQRNSIERLTGSRWYIKIPIAYFNRMLIERLDEENDALEIIFYSGNQIEDSFTFSWKQIYDNLIQPINLPFIKSIDPIQWGRIDGQYEQNAANDEIWIEFNCNELVEHANANNYDGITTIAYKNTSLHNAYGKLQIIDFDLSNIDDMRYDLLSSHTLGSAFVIANNENAYLPYKSLVDVDANGKSLNTYPLNGLLLKTYQNDIFNNWLNTEWIEGENSITELTKVAIVDGSFSMDALNFAQKQYNMLNRIATAGATYEDWQDVVYEEVKRRQIESPIFCGGMSQEIVFDEIVQTAPAEGKPLGELGGRGKLLMQGKKGGKIHIKCDEACFIIAIVSLTPRTYYTQGNEFYLTDVLSMDDIHKPPMDGIGFQDLIGERMAYFDTVLREENTTPVHRSKIGKLPAWIEYMTSYDRAHGDFAKEDGFGYMILNRNYEQDPLTGGIKDATTYVDPEKYNYVFAYKDLDAQNFWVQIAFNIKARRLMSARLIPNV